MDLKAVRTTKEEELPWRKNSIYKYSSEGRYPEIIIRIDGKLFFDMDAFKELARKSRNRQVEQAKRARREF